MKKFVSFLLIFGMLCTVGFSTVGCGKKEEAKKEAKKDAGGDEKKDKKAG